jgi:hypothetical protein
MKFVWIALTMFCAFGLGKRVLFWALMSYLFSWAALIAVLAIPANQKRLEARRVAIEEWSNKQVEENIVQKEIKNINTVDDLFNQLEKPKG